MKDASKKSLSEFLTIQDRAAALEKLRCLVDNIPIRDDQGTIIGYIKDPDMRAIQFVIEQTEYLTNATPSQTKGT
jgi:hypothetical protein